MLRRCSNPSNIDDIVETYKQPTNYWNYLSSMEHFNISSVDTTYQAPAMDPEPGVGLPDLFANHVPQLCYRTSQPPIATEQWLTSESPVARAASYSDQTSIQNRYRLPSLACQTSIPDAQYQPQYTVQMPNSMYPLSTALPEHIPPHGLQVPDFDGEHHAANYQNSSFWANDISTATGYHDMPWVMGQEYMHARYPPPSLSGYSSPTMLNGSPAVSEYCSSPEPYPPVRGGRIPRSQPKDGRDIDDGEEMNGGKPYAQLIQECLLQAPGNKMMLRDIYEWFEMNTNKPFECSGNGWQNSIRHNLSMNQAFENDKTTVTNSRGEPKKATSIWYLTDYALRHGVQSTTRYRAKTGPRRSAYSHDRDWKRMSSGSKGGRAARKATHMRRLKAEQWPSRMSSENLKPFDHLVRAANALDDYPSSRGTSPVSSTDEYPCTPKDSLSGQGYPLENIADPMCHGGELSFNDLQLHDALSQAGFGRYGNSLLQ